MSKYRIFISHKEEDFATATAVKKAITKFAGQLDCFIAAESIAPGEDWRKRLRTQLQDTDLLLLLFTAPTRNWDWCLYEAGLFTRLRKPEDRMVVCIHEGTEPPRPLLDRQAVEADVPAVTSFLSTLIRTTDITGRDEPLNDQVSDDDLQSAAEDICDHFGTIVEPYYTTYRATLALPSLPADEDQFDGIPDDASLTAPESTLRLFGRTRASTWGELVKDRRDDDEAWLDDLDEVFARACRGKVAAPVTTTFVSEDGTHILRPQLYRVDLRNTTPTAAVVLFLEEVAPPKVGGALFNRLRVAERYHREVFELVRSADDPSGEDLAAWVRAFRLIREEARVHDVFAQDSFLRLFPDDHEQRQMQALSRSWDDTRDRMEDALAEGDDDGLLAALRALSDLNDDYRARVATRYADHVQVDAMPSVRSDGASP